MFCIIKVGIKDALFVSLFVSCMQQHDSLVDFKFDSGPDTPPTLKLSWGEKTELTKKVHKTEVGSMGSGSKIILSTCI